MTALLTADADLEVRPCAAALFDADLDQAALALVDFLTVNLTLTNCSEFDAAEVVQFYLSDLQASTVVPPTDTSISPIGTRDAMCSRRPNT